MVLFPLSERSRGHNSLTYMHSQPWINQDMQSKLTRTTNCGVSNLILTFQTKKEEEPPSSLWQEPVVTPAKKLEPFHFSASESDDNDNDFSFITKSIEEKIEDINKVFNF